MTMMMMMMMLGGKKSNAHWDRVLYTRRGGSMKRRDRDATLYPRGSEGKEYVAAKLRMGRKYALRWSSAEERLAFRSNDFGGWISSRWNGIVWKKFFLVGKLEEIRCEIYWIWKVKNIIFWKCRKIEEKFKWKNTKNVEFSRLNCMEFIINCNFRKVKRNWTIDKQRMI